jgi:cyclic pyranopterin phosphate synthase
MVNIRDKIETFRQAVSVAYIETGDKRLKQELSEEAIRELICLARLSGIQAAKKTHELIPLCHQIPLDHVHCDIEVIDNVVVIRCTVECHHKTGVEMEAMTAVSVASLAVYDMIKSRIPEAIINNISLEKKSGGKSGLWQRCRHV